MSIKEVKGLLKEKKVFINNQEEAELLLRGGYGSAFEDSLILTSYEAIYLLSEKRIKIINNANNEPLCPKSLLKKFEETESEVWTKYLIYRDLRSRGYVVRAGVGWGINFRAYERGTYGVRAAKFIIFAICEGSPIPIGRLQEAMIMAQNMKKEIIVAVMDRRGEIVYYSLTRLNLQ